MAIPMYHDVPAPVLTPYRHGLLSVATVIEDPDPHWRLGVQYDTDACATGGIWDPRCADGFTVTLTRTATATQFSVDLDPTAGPYEMSVDGGAFAPVVDGAVFVEATNPFTVIVREVGGLGRTVTITGIDPTSIEGTIYTGTSQEYAANTPKTLEGLEVVTGDPFAVYSGIDCKGLGIGDAEARAFRRLAAAEQRLVELHVWETQLATSNATILEGGVATPLKAAIGALEVALGQNYGGIGVIHASRGFSPFAADRYQIWPDGPVLRTSVGTAWAFGGGYLETSPTGTAPPADQMWIYATGAVVARHSEMFVPAGLQTGALNTTTNDAFVVAERSYVVTTDCVLYAVLVDLAGEE